MGQEPVREYCDRLHEKYNGTTRVKRGTGLQTFDGTEGMSIRQIKFPKLDVNKPAWINNNVELYLHDYYSIAKASKAEKLQ